MGQNLELLNYENNNYTALGLMKQRLFDPNNEYMDTNFLLQYEIGNMEVESEAEKISQELFIHNSVSQDGSSFVQVISGYIQVFSKMDENMKILSKKLEKFIPELLESFGLESIPEESAEL